MNVENLPEEKREEIQKRIDESTEKYRALKAKNDARRAKRKAFKAICHEGNEFLKELHKDEVIKEQTVISTMDLKGDFGVTAVLIPFPQLKASREGFTVCKSAYAIKAPTDDERKHVGTGLCGYRIKHGGEFTATLEVPSALLKVRHGMVRDIMDSIVRSRILLQAAEIPQRMINAYYLPALKELKNKGKIDELKKKAEEAANRQDFISAQKYIEEAMRLEGAPEDVINEGREKLMPLIQMAKQMGLSS